MKKSTKGLMSALLLMAMCGAVGCGNKESSPAGTSSTTSEAPVSSSVESSSQTPSSSTSSEEVSATTDLLTQVEDGGQGVYNVTNADGKTTLAFNKTNADEHIYAFAKVDLGSLAHKDQMKTLRFTVSGAGKLEMKFEGSKGSKAITFLVYETKGYYEWNLTAMGELDERIAAADKLLFFAQPGSLGSGEIVFDELTITTDFAGEDSKYTIVNDGWTNIVAGSNVYDGASATFDFNRNWVDNDGTVHTFEYIDDTTVVTYTKSDTYQFASTEISGDYGKFEYINFKVKGTSGDAVLFKVEGNGKSKEMTIPFDGNEQTYTLDLRGFTREERQAFNKVLMFAAPGNAEATGTYTVIDAYYSSTFDGTNFEYPTNVYNGTSNTFDVNANWHDSGDGVYEVLNDVSPFEVSYDKGNYEYPALRSKVSGLFGNFKKLTFGLELPVGKSAIVKVEGTGVGKEITVDGAGAYAFGTLDLSDLTVTQRNNIAKVLIMVEPGTKNVTGTFKIHHIGFEGFEAQDTTGLNIYNGTANDFGCNANWYDGGDNVYTVETLPTGPFAVTYTNAGAYSSLKTNVFGRLENFTKLKFGVLVPEGKTIMIKVANKEVTVTGTGKYDDSVYLDISGLSADEKNAIREVIIFAEPGTENVSGTFEIHWMSFQY